MTLADEATASLDIENELAVKQAIANLLKEKKTVVMIAHTLSIVKNADQILVVSDGKIAEAGTHAYSARTAHPFQRNGAPFRFKLSKAQQVD